MISSVDHVNFVEREVMDWDESDLIPSYPVMSDDDFYRKIMAKREFWTPFENQESFGYQISIARLFQQWTLYTSLMVVHDAGTGKSGIATAVLNQVLHNPDQKYFYVVDNETKLDNFVSEVMQWSKDVKELMEYRTKGHAAEMSRRHFKEILSSYGVSFYTYYQLFQEFQAPTESVQKRFENSIFVMDECHNLSFSGRAEWPLRPFSSEDSEGGAESLSLTLVLYKREFPITVPEATGTVLDVVRRAFELQGFSKESVDKMVNLYPSSSSLRLSVNDEIISDKPTMRLKEFSWMSSAAASLRIKIITPVTKTIVYDTLVHGLDSLKEKKVLLMTATPVTDNIFQICPLWNLLLPKEKRFEESTFVQTYFDRDCVGADDDDDEDSPVPREDDPSGATAEEDGLTLCVYRWKADKERLMTQLLGGRFSVRRIQYSVDVTYEGQLIRPMQYLVLYPYLLSDFQNKVYMSKLSSGSSFFSQAIQSKLFVFPNENRVSTVKCFHLFVQSPSTDHEIIKDMRFSRSAFLEYEKGRDDSGWITLQSATSVGASLEDKLGFVEQYSTLYADVIYRVLNSTKKELFLIYSDIVSGSGIRILALLLQEIFGFSIIQKASQLTSGHLKKDGRNFLLLDQDTPHGNVQQLTRFFNRPWSENGGYPLVKGAMIIKKTSEGISLFNIQNIHILTPSWNFPPIVQAIARGIRTGSHRDVEDAHVKIFLHCAFPHNPTESFLQEQQQEQQNITSFQLRNSVDFRMYQKSEAKEKNVKLLDYFMKINSWDCILQYPKNIIKNPKLDYSRECDFQKCAYECAGFPASASNPIEEIWDDSTFMSFYAQVLKGKIKSEIRRLFLRCQVLMLYDVDEYLRNVFTATKDVFGYSLLLLCETLSEMIFEISMPLRNVLGQPRFLQIHSSFLFLTDNPFTCSVQEPFLTFSWLQRYSINQRLCPRTLPSLGAIVDTVPSTMESLVKPVNTLRYLLSPQRREATKIDEGTLAQMNLHAELLLQNMTAPVVQLLLETLLETYPRLDAYTQQFSRDLLLYIRSAFSDAVRMSDETSSSDHLPAFIEHDLSAVTRRWTPETGLFDSVAPAVPAPAAPAKAAAVGKTKKPAIEVPKRFTDDNPVGFYAVHTLSPAKLTVRDVRNPAVTVYGSDAKLRTKGQNVVTMFKEKIMVVYFALMKVLFPDDGAVEGRRWDEPVLRDLDVSSSSEKVKKLTWYQKFVELDKEQATIDEFGEYWKDFQAVEALRKEQLMTLMMHWFEKAGFLLKV